jgi:cytochrome c553
MGNERSFVIMRTVLVASLLLLGSAAWAAEGADTFKTACAKCHGETGMSDTPQGKSLKVPHLAGDEKVAAKGVDELVKGIKETKKHPASVKSASDDKLKAAAEYAHSLAAKK